MTMQLFGSRLKTKSQGPLLWGALLFTVLIGCATNALARGPAGDEQHAERVVSIADCIRMTKLGDPDYWLGGSSQGRVAQFSPDGKMFVVVLRKGNLEENANEYSLVLWRTSQISHSSPPVVILTMSSSSNLEAIEGVRWLEDNETLAFLGEHPNEQRQVYVVSAGTGIVRKLTNHPTNIIAFSISPDGNQIAYIAEKPVESLWDEKTRREGLLVSKELLPDLVVGRKYDASGYYGELELFFQSNSKVTGPLDSKGRINLFHSTPKLSPDGKYVLIATQTQEIPEHWKEYEDPSVREYSTQILPKGRYSYLERYILIDTKTGDTRVLLDSPVRMHGSDVAWSPDGHSVAISGVYLPLENTQGEERKHRQSKLFTVEVGVPGGEVTRIDEGDFRLVGWEKKGRVVLEAGNATPRRVLFAKTEGSWKKVSDGVHFETRPDIVLEEDMNTRPKIYAVDSDTHNKSLLLDLNPQFEKLRFARVEEIEWKGSDGHDVKGGLYYPVDYVAGGKYPLVIQTHGWDAKKFWIDGPWTSAFAAQALAGKGFAVLQVPDPDENLEDTPGEPQRAVAVFEGAIEYLDRKGFIDRRRVGLIGFSRTGLYVRYALTHSKYHFVAASVMDTTDGGYFQYLAFFNVAPGWAEAYERLNGGLPYGEGLLSWMKNSPGFNIDRVQTPFRIVAPRSSDSLLSEWEWFAALTRLGKPVELVLLEDGVHILQRPWDRIVSQQGNVDWFAFWLKGEEDSAPAKAEQYKRWRELRKLQEANQAEKRPN
jgi:dipeptidyl aminopeptidase/acylaminoacyl peptidase